eukprot:CAMPEP_0174819424 /NCGR_PEP_ID=MMETSP1107-20130205/2640_1 /TAXON_ID=36770 /ORGANISM="Paraphysomonas vestita, Strain GFlagA" /LENGTH=683 /DNA_ID=CAMNT_0016032877 /DNA_START=358 /DNA_END=2409 /DNA_ORIENTATION=-
MIDKSHSGTDQYSAFNPKASTFKPYYFKTDLLAYSTNTGSTSIEFTSTSHGAIMEVNYPSYDVSTSFNQTRRIIIDLNGGSDTSSIGTLEDGTIAIFGTSTANSGGIPSNSDYGNRFVIGIYGGENGDKLITNDYILETSANSQSAWIDFKPEDDITQKITLRIATSFISSEQALTNYNYEVSTKVSFNDVKENSKDQWNTVLSRVSIDEIHSTYTQSEQTDLYTTFYSSLYRASLFPRQLTEIDSNGNEVHWSPYSSTGTRVFNGPISTDSGFWDAYSTVYPLLSIINVPVLSKTLQGWVNAYKEGGWLPKWASPGYRGSMVGTMGDVSIADAIVKEIPGFDVKTAYEAIYKDAFVPSDPNSGTGRECIASYLKFGYIPHGTCSEVVSRTLDYYQSDFAIAKAAEKLNDLETANILKLRYANYSSLFDYQSGFIRSINEKTGKFTEPFDAFAWGGDYTEAGPWQYRFSIPFDVPGLAKLYQQAGQDICTELNNAQTMPSIYHLGGYGNQIHEMTEMTVNCWGQYSHSNQPVHHMLYMFGSVYPDEGVTSTCASTGQYYIRKALSTLYKPTDEMFAGDEDNGEMGAWYILSSIGLYSLSPGTEDYVFGSPLFQKVTISLEGNGIENAASDLIIQAHDNSAENVYVQSVKFNGTPITINSIKYSDLMKGGLLEFQMGSSPSSKN